MEAHLVEKIGRLVPDVLSRASIDSKAVLERVCGIADHLFHMSGPLGLALHVLPKAGRIGHKRCNGAVIIERGRELNRQRLQRLDLLHP